VPNQKIALNTSRKYATHPHLAGSIEDFEDAKVILELFQSQLGIDSHGQLPLYSAGSDDSRHATLTLSSANQSTAWIDVYYPVMNTPLDRAVEILDEDGTLVASLDLVEDGDALDPEAAKYRDAVPAFHGFSHNGEAQGHLVFANYGTQEDYETLDAKGIDLTGKIVIARYGKIFRGLKVRLNVFVLLLQCSIATPGQRRSRERRSGCSHLL
jgi:N-acetylated-alpha-linked acidic dipeptidase